MFYHYCNSCYNYGILVQYLSRRALMEWLLFTYWLPPEPSRKRVFIWRQLKKIGALSTEGGGWLLPKTEPLPTAISDIIRSVEELEGTANLYTLTHFNEAQEQRN